MVAASTSAELREQNRSRALALVHEAGGSLTRVELAELLDVTRTTAAALVSDLSALNLILEHDADPTGRRGRPTTNISPHPEGPVVLAAEVANDRITVAEVAIGGELRRREDVSLASDDPSEAVDQLDQVLHERRASLVSTCAGIGVAMHGLVDDDSGLVVQAPNLGWENVPLGRRLRQSHRLPVKVDNDATLGALVEAKRGSGRLARTMLYLRSTVGIGGGLVFDGKPAPSRRGWHGEFGHLPFGDQGRQCRCGALGCWENAINQLALAEAAGVDADRVTANSAAADVLNRARAGDADAAGAVARICTVLGRGLGSLINALDPEVIVLSGHVQRLYETDPSTTVDALKAASMRAHRQSLPPVRSGVVEHPALAGAAEAILADLIGSPTRLLAPS